MSIHSGLYAFLTADAGVSALVGTRVYPLVIPDQVFDEATKRPCLVYGRQTVDPRKTFCETIALRRSTFAVDCYAKTMAVAQSLALAVKSALVDYRGAMDDVTVSDVSLETETDLMDLEPGLFRVALSFAIWHTE